jgi:NADH:ubiquinone oxidoreductase subunit 5 (subunit L)/multisubunit Na+/H+ antiporter MnhA subunit
LPGTGNFVGEFLILIGTFASAPWITVIATSGLVFGSVYSLIMIHRAYFGPSKSDAVLQGMDARELIMVLGLAALLIYIGVYPQPFLDTLPPRCMACSSGSAPPSLNSLRPGKSAMEFTTQHFIALAPLLITSATIIVVMLAIAWRRNHSQTFLISVAGLNLACCRSCQP